MNRNVQALALNPAQPATIYAGAGLGVFRSTDSGTTWSVLNTGLTSTNVQALSLNPSTPATIYAGTPGGVFKTTNDGTGWSAVNSGLGVKVGE